jgi:hypothetical protein
MEFTAEPAISSLFNFIRTYPAEYNRPHAGRRVHLTLILADSA